MRIFFKYTLFYSTIIPSEGNQSDNRQRCHKKIIKITIKKMLWFSKFTKEHSPILDLVTHYSYALI